MKLDRIVLYEILKWDFKLSNVFMRTCKALNRQIHENKTLMNKLAKHYQPLLEKRINFELYKIFFKDSDGLRNELDAINLEFDDELANHNIAPIRKHGPFPKYSDKRITNILINDNDTHKIKGRITTKKEVILMGQNNYILKSFHFKKVCQMLNDNLHSIFELQKMSKIYRNSTGYHLIESNNGNESNNWSKKGTSFYKNKLTNEEITLTLLQNFDILLNLIDEHEMERKLMLSDGKNGSSSAGTFIKYFLVVILLFYLRYAFMK